MLLLVSYNILNLCYYIISFSKGNFVKTLLLLTLAFILAPAAYAGTSMKVEGTCTGTILSRMTISFTYYSNFEGCTKVSDAALSFTKGLEGLFTGKRRFTTTQDIYTLSGGHNLTFANSTGNTSANLTYQGETVRVQCQVRDYEYEDC